MNIQRNTGRVRPGRMDEAVAELKAQMERVKVDGRILTPVFGPFDQIVFEFRFEDHNAEHKFWEHWFALPTTPQFFEQAAPRYLPGGSNERWQIHDPVAGFGSGKIVNRQTVLVKVGRMPELLQLLLAMRESGKTPFEVETAIYGPVDTLAMDFTFESIAAHDQAWADWAASEQTGPFLEKWFELTEVGLTNEIWEVR